MLWEGREVSDLEFEFRRENLFLKRENEKLKRKLIESISHETIGDMTILDFIRVRKLINKLFFYDSFLKYF